MLARFLLLTLLLPSHLPANASEFENRDSAARAAENERAEQSQRALVNGFNASAMKAIRSFAAQKQKALQAGASCKSNHLGTFDSCDFVAGNLACQLVFGQGMSQNGADRKVYNDRYACTDGVYFNSYVFNCIDQRGQRSQTLLRREGEYRQECEE